MAPTPDLTALLRGEIDAASILPQPVHAPNKSTVTSYL